MLSLLPVIHLRVGFSDRPLYADNKPSYQKAVCAMEQRELEA